MPQRTLAIGDIHGCAEALDAVLAAMAPQRDDLLVLLGDYVDRGPDSRRVVERILRLSDQCQLVTLLGNHEMMLLAALEDRLLLPVWRDTCGGAATMASYGGNLSDLPADHLAFIENCPLYFETDRYVFVHANYEPERPLEQQPSDRLLWTHLSDPLPAPHCSGKMVIVGHTPQISGEYLDAGHLLCLDTHCYGGGWLTGLDLDARIAWQADQRGQLRVRSDG